VAEHKTHITIDMLLPLTLTHRIVIFFELIR